MNPALSRRAAAQGGVFTAVQARKAGYERQECKRLLASGAWIQLRRGIYAPKASVDTTAHDPRARHRLDIAAALLVMGRKELVAAKTSAAAIWELETGHRSSQRCSW